MGELRIAFYIKKYPVAGVLAGRESLVDAARHLNQRQLNQSGSISGGEGRWEKEDADVPWMTADELSRSTAAAPSGLATRAPRTPRAGECSWPCAVTCST